MKEIYFKKKTAQNVYFLTCIHTEVQCTVHLLMVCDYTAFCPTAFKCQIFLDKVNMLLFKTHALLSSIMFVLN
jgi:hypothetical protein